MTINPLVILAALTLGWATPASGVDREGSAALVIRANREAVGSTVSSWHDLRMEGIATSRGGTGRVLDVIDLTTNLFASRYATGPAVVSQGYDGQSWVAHDGIVSVVDLPGLRRDAVTSAYTARQGWLRDDDATAKQYIGRRMEGSNAFDVLRVTPAGGERADLWFDARSHVLARTIIDADYGPDRTTYRDYRRVDGVLWPFTTVETDPTGEATTIHFTNVRFGSAVTPNALARPRSQPVGVIGADAKVRFRSDSPAVMAHIVLPVRLLGRTVSVLFDTGGQNSLSPAAAQSLHLPSSGTMNIGGSGGTEAASIAAVGTMGIGTAALEEQRFLVLPLPYQFLHPTRELTVAGIVGAEILANFRVRIDYADRTFTLSSFGERFKSTGITVPFLSDGSHPYVRASIDGARGLFGIDTGDSGGVVVFDGFARRHHLYTARGIRYVGLGVGGGDKEDAYRGHQFELGGVSMERPVVHIPRTSGTDVASASIAGNVRADVLSRFTITFDYRARTVTFEPNATVHRPFLQDMTGLTVVQRRPGDFEVIAIALNTPAVAAGLEVGDRVVAVDGRPVTGMGVKDFNVFLYGATPFSVTVLRSRTPVILHIRPRELLAVWRAEGSNRFGKKIPPAFALAGRCGDPADQPFRRCTGRPALVRMDVAREDLRRYDTTR